MDTVNVDLRVGERTIRVPVLERTVRFLPDAPAFLRYLAEERGIAIATACEYARLVAKAKRDGTVNDPNLIRARVEQTAVRAYWKWIEPFYESRVRPVVRALPFARGAIGQLRISSLVPPHPGKVIPVKAPPKFELQWVPSDRWTLHVPQVETPKDGAPPITVAPHTDPCESCSALELDDQQLQVIAAVFHAAWGPRTPAGVWPPRDLPAECFLFGQPPQSSVYGHQPRDSSRIGRVTALLEGGPLSDLVDSVRGSVTPSNNTFIERLQQHVPDVVVIDRAAAGDRLMEVLEAVASAWRPVSIEMNGHVDAPTADVSD